MPKPTYAKGAPAPAPKKPKGLLSNLFMNSKDREALRQQQAEEAQKEMTNDRAANEQKIIDILKGINFVNNKIPPEILNYKSEPEQKYGDLEDTARTCVAWLIDSPEFMVDISVIDSKLLQFAKNFSDAVAVGHVRQAYTAKGALATCISNIRNEIPYVDEKLMEGYLNECSRYMDSWLLLIDFARVADNQEHNISVQERQYNKDKTTLEENKAELKDKLDNDDKLQQAYLAIRDQTAKTDITKWTDDMREVRKLLTNMNLEQIRVGLSGRMLDGLRLNLVKQENAMDTLNTRVANLPIPKNPNADNLYKEEVDAIFAELAAYDQSIDEMLKNAEELDGRLAMLDNAPGAVHLRNALTDQAMKFEEEIREKQEEELKALRANQTPNGGLSYKNTKDHLKEVEQALEEKKRLDAILQQQQVVHQVQETDNELYNE